MHAAPEAFHPEMACVTSHLSVDMANPKATFPFQGGWEVQSHNLIQEECRMLVNTD